MAEWRSEVKSASRILKGLTPDRMATISDLYSDWQMVRARLCRRPLYDGELNTKRSVPYRDLALRTHQMAHRLPPERITPVVVRAMKYTVDFLCQHNVTYDDVDLIVREWARSGIEFSSAQVLAQTPLLPVSVISSEYLDDITEELADVAAEANGYVAGRVTRIDDDGAACIFWPGSEDRVYVLISADQLAVRGISNGDAFQVTATKQGEALMVQFFYAPPRQPTAADEEAFSAIDAKAAEII